MSPFKTEEQRKEWGRKMKELREKKRLEREAAQKMAIQEKAAQSLDGEGNIKIKYQSGDILEVPKWLAKDLIRKGEAELL